MLSDAPGITLLAKEEAPALELDRRLDGREDPVVEAGSELELESAVLELEGDVLPLSAEVVVDARLGSLDDGVPLKTDEDTKKSLLLWTDDGGWLTTKLLLESKEVSGEGLLLVSLDVPVPSRLLCVLSAFSLDIEDMEDSRASVELLKDVLPLLVAPGRAPPSLVLDSWATLDETGLSEDEVTPGVALLSRLCPSIVNSGNIPPSPVFDRPKLDGRGEESEFAVPVASASLL